MYRKLKPNLELIINNISSPILAGNPIIDSNNVVTDFKIVFRNKAFVDIAEEELKKVVLFSEAKNAENLRASYLEKINNIINNIPEDKDTFFYSDKEAWFRIEMSYEQSENLIISTFTDITAEKQFNTRLQLALTTDSLTGLSNRAGLFIHLDDILKQSAETNTVASTLILDIDNLKNINDSLGTKEGDALIIRVANILTHFRSKDIEIFRYGGDEFVVVMANLKDEDSVAIITDKIFNAFQSKKVKVSGGISVFPMHTQNKEELIRFGDMALCYAKKNGKNNFSYFEDYMQKVFIKHLTLESKMSSAIMESSFKQVYQPQFDVHTGELRGFEALIRWSDPDLGDIPPSIFIPLAEESGLIVPIGNWVLQTALKTIKDWQDKYNFTGVMSVNVSPVQLNQDNFIFDLAKMVIDYGINPELLEIEITEGVMINNMNETIDKLQAIKDMGLKVSLDDFGTGYSSLSYLQMLPLNTLKIDKSFINNITSEDGIQANITSSIITMVKNMGLETIAEGVENAEQLALLHKFNCNIVQGYLRGKPMPLNLCEEYLAGNENALITINSKI